MAQGPEKGISAKDLGHVILNGVPYGYKKGKPHAITEEQAHAVRYKESWPETPPDDDITYPTEGPARNNDYENPLDEDKIKRLKKHPDECIWWHFDGKYVRVTKAVKIPYVVVDEDGKETLEHLLVGYMGIDGGG